MIMTDAVTKTHAVLNDAGRLLYKNIYLSLYYKGSKRLCGVLQRERESWRPNITEIFWPQNLWPSKLCLSRSSDAQPEPWGRLCWVLAFFTASYQHLLWTPIHQGFLRSPSAGCGFPYHISSPTPSDLQLLATQLARRTQLSYIIARRPLELEIECLIVIKRK